MFSYLAFLYGKTSTLKDPFTDGQELARQCVAQLSELNDPDQFPPRLLILFTPKQCSDPMQASQLLAGITQTFEEAKYENVPLIGGSAASVFFDRKVHPDGALLICLASRILEAKVAAAANVTRNAAKAIDGMLDELGLHAKPGEDVNPFANLLLFALFPGFSNQEYPAPKLYSLMQEKLRARAPIFGGVTSTGDPKRIVPGLQYANGVIHQDAVVVSRIASATPVGLSFAHGLTETSCILQVSELGPDRRTIKTFHQGSALDLIREKEKQSRGVVLLENISIDRQSWMGSPEPVKSNGSIQMLRDIEDHAAFRIWRPDPAQMHKKIAKEVQNSTQRIRLQNPIGCLGIRCAGYPWISKKIKLRLETELEEIEQLTGPYVGAFMAGEAGTDSFGRSYLSNWHTATLIFGDELRDRSTFHRGFIELADFARGPAIPTPKETFARLLRLIYEIGYPGAMISLVLRDVNGEMIVAQDAIGTRFKKIVELTRRRSDGTDILAAVLRAQKPEFVRDCTRDTRNDHEAIQVSGTLSQYIIPLLTLRDEVIGLLQIDLGDASYKKALHSNEEAVLDALGSTVNSSLNRVFNWEENKIVHGLDKALKDCLSRSTVNDGLMYFLEGALNAFRLEMGHIRLSKPGSSELMLVGGKGEYAELAAKYRPKIDTNDPSPSIRALFKPNKAIVINDVKSDPGHKRMCAQYSDPLWTDTMAQVGSYINVGFASESGERGTISLISKTSWFFNWHHERACLALGGRVAYLVQQLRLKENENAARMRRRAVRARVALVAQSGHRFNALLGRLQVMPAEIRDAMPAEIRNPKGKALYDRVDELAKRVDEARKEVTRRLDLAEKASRVNFGPSNLAYFLRKVVAEAIAARPVPGLRHKLAIRENLVVEIDRELMKEAVLNLIDNSLKAMTNLESRKPVLKIVVTIDREKVKIVVEDNGEGMRKNKLDALKRTISDRPNDNKRSKLKGLGLPITSIMLDAHSGKIHDIESKENGGTIVTVVFPLHQQEEAYDA